MTEGERAQQATLYRLPWKGAVHACLGGCSSQVPRMTASASPAPARCTCRSSRGSPSCQKILQRRMGPPAPDGKPCGGGACPSSRLLGFSAQCVCPIRCGGSHAEHWQNMPRKRLWGAAYIAQPH